jgi:hypothetical protein
LRNGGEDVADIVFLAGSLVHYGDISPWTQIFSSEFYIFVFPVVYLVYSLFNLIISSHLINQNLVID